LGFVALLVDAHWERDTYVPTASVLEFNCVGAVQYVRGGAATMMMMMMMKMMMLACVASARYRRLQHTNERPIKK